MNRSAQILKGDAIVIPAADVELARAVPLVYVIEARGLRLRRQGAELCGPCPVCAAGHDRFSVNTRKSLWLCRHRGRGGNDAVSLVRFLDGCTFAVAVATLAGTAAVTATTPKGTPRPQKDHAGTYACQQARKAGWLWGQRHAITGSPAERYLRDVRGYTGPIPPTLAFLPATKPEHHPAVIAAFAVVRDVEPGILAEPCFVDAVHLTQLKPDGSDKANVERPKRCIGSPSGRPITLAPPNELLGMAITEGIEDGLTVHAATGLGVWAAGSATLMPALAEVVPSYIEAVTIYAHDDKSGRIGALALAERLPARGIDVFIEGLP